MWVEISWGHFTDEISLERPATVSGLLRTIQPGHAVGTKVMVMLAGKELLQRTSYLEVRAWWWGDTQALLFGGKKGVWLAPLEVSCTSHATERGERSSPCTMSWTLFFWGPQSRMPISKMLCKTDPGKNPQKTGRDVGVEYHREVLSHFEDHHCCGSRGP